MPGKSRAGQQEETSKLTEQHGCFTLPSDLVRLNMSEVGSLQKKNWNLLRESWATIRIELTQYQI